MDLPWLEPRQVALPDDSSFLAWVHERWPAPPWSVKLDPWQLALERSP